MSFDTVSLRRANDRAPNGDSLGDRMKRYEQVPRIRLMPRTPVLIRLDGKAFHSWTKGLERPWDERFHRAMWDTAKALCEKIHGCRLAYVQSDEITLLLTDYRKHTTQPWFDQQVQKMVSVAASIATAHFNLAVADLDIGNELPAYFDARAWNLPQEEVCNAFIWRQQDATRNSISALAQAHFSHSQLHGVSCDGMQDMLMVEKGINWNDCPTPQKRGVCVVKQCRPFAPGPIDTDQPPSMQRLQKRWAWTIDLDIPVFTQDRDYVERWLGFPEDEDRDDA